MNNQWKDQLQSTKFELPRTVLFALLEPEHPASDVERAGQFGLLKDGQLTELGKMVLSGFDQTAVRQKLIALDKARKAK